LTADGDPTEAAGPLRLSAAPSAIEVIRVPRRAPFAENPNVGERGARTQHRILRAALEVFGDVGFRPALIEQISDVAGCSRSSFYQYFASKEDLFRKLGWQVARQMLEMAEAVGPVTPDDAGHSAVREWLEHFSDLFDGYVPVFAAFDVAADLDSDAAAGGHYVRQRHARVMEQWFTTDLYWGEGDGAAVDVLSHVVMMVVRTNRYRLHLTDLGPVDRDRVNDALADVIHRIAYGPLASVNLWSAHHRLGSVGDDLGRAAAEVFLPASGSELGSTGRRTRRRLLDAAAEVFVRKGYHDTRIDDITELAGTSHGTFYRYFTNKEQVFRTLAVRAGGRLVASLDELLELGLEPLLEVEGEQLLRRWLRRREQVAVDAGPITRMWMEVMVVDQDLHEASWRSMEDNRRRLARFLEPRGFGDVDSDALVVLALLVEVGRRRPWLPDGDAGTASIETLLRMIQRGIFGQDAGR
jgi:AcrR family transcriptional regulator